MKLPTPTEIHDRWKQGPPVVVARLAYKAIRDLLSKELLEEIAARPRGKRDAEKTLCDAIAAIDEALKENAT